MRNYKISRRNFLAVAGTLTAAAALTACGGSASSTVASSTASSSVASDSTPAAASGTGKVTVYMPSPAGLADKLAEGFTAKTGIEVEQFQGTTGEILARLEAEAANPVADVVILASWSDSLSMKADDKLESYTPENADLIVDGWLDDDSVLFGYSASAVGVIYNTTVFSTLDADWKDLGNAEYKDQLAIPDPEKSGACKDFVAGYVVKNGWDDFQAMADNGMTVPGANKAALEAVTTGEVGILVAGVDYNAYSSKNKGEPLDIYYPAGGTIVNPRPAMILKTAPNMLQNYITTRKSYNLVSGKGARRVEQSMGKGATVGAWAYIVLVLLIAVGVPYFSVISTSLINLRGYGLAPGNFTIAHYVELFTENEKGLSALKNSVFLAVTSATICAVLGTLLVLAVRKSHSKLRKVVEVIGLLPEMLPGIVLVIGIMLFWNQIYNILPLYNTMGIMVLAYVVLFLPYTVQYVTSSFTQISDSLMAAGQVFGGSPVYILRRITLPLIRQGIATGWMMTFIIAFRELVTASLIAPPDTLVVSTFIVREFEQGSVSVGMAMAVLCVLFSTTALLILNTVIDHRKVH